MDAGGRAVPGAVAEGWGEGGRFTPEQLKWLEMIRDHIAANLSIAPDDFDKFDRIEFGRTLVRRAAVSARDGASQYAPFSQQGGLGKVHQLFGDKLNTIIEELNETLAA
jgi:type I restriction enzyme R subunit